MTMEERTSSIEDGARTISTGATINSSSPNSIKNKLYELTPGDAAYPLQRTTPSKRSFDVAFLVAPDEKLIKRQSEKLANLQLCTNRLMNDAIRQQQQQLQQQVVSIDSEDSHEYEHHSDRIPQNLTIKHFEAIKIRRAEEHQSPTYTSPKRRLTSPADLSPESSLIHPLYAGLLKSPSPNSLFQRTQVRKLFSDESVSKSTSDCDSLSCSDTRSAFTKVAISNQRNDLVEVNSNLVFDDGTASPRSSVSPDVIAYQNSLSPPVPVGAFSPRATTSFPTKTPPLPYPFLLSPDSVQTSAVLDNLNIGAQQAPKTPSPKSSSVNFRPETPSVNGVNNSYPPLPYNPLSAVFPPIGAETLTRPRFLAAASLIPSSLAALALPAQNICAKCNLSFRMTSDLVYHMRSHHKSEHAGESARRRREEKLRCPVCDESFRERHHLTRHMTAHQDKESDAVVDQVEIKRRAAAAATATMLQGK
ncbi:hypothetical protein TKK_0005911 [Trichogramma kaykai]|uniref:C2H2-type domain-containing protein n=1 Tax=Trichogramma kaykai TaxID=54128 RepID=A0ABD2XH56_9HYME